MSDPQVQAFVPEMQSIEAFFTGHTSFGIIGHEEPDGDCFCSQLLIESLLDRLGKPTCLLSAGPFVRPEIQEMRKRFVGSLSDCGGGIDALVIVDCSTPERIGSIAKEVGSIETAVIDHHASGSHFGDVRFVDPSAPSVTYMIYELMRYLNFDPTRTEAELLLFGMCTDTGFFRHLDASSGRVFSAVAEITKAGASPNDAYHRMYGNRSFESRLLLGRLLSRVTRYFDGRLLLTYESADELSEFGADHRDSDSLYQLLQGVAGCRAVALIRIEPNGNCSVGLRSRDSLDVGSIAHKHGGGGHRNASGFETPSGIDEIRNVIVADFADCFANEIP